MLLLALLVQHCRKPIKETPHVFMMVSEAALSQEMPAVEMPKMALKAPDRPKAATPPTPAKAPEPEVKPMSYEEFIKKQGQPKARAPRLQTPKAVSAPKLDVGKLTAQLEQVLVHDESGKTIEARFPVDSSKLNRFIADVRSRIDASWIKPEKLAALHPAAIVEFTVEPNGHIAGVHVVQSSGHPVFDRSVLEAFSRAGSVSAPPEKRRYTLRLTFKMLDS